MQKLIFESSWDKALSNKDRKEIEETFLETNGLSNDSIQLVPLWIAFNYKDELLVTMLIHNFTHQPFSFLGKQLRYLENNEIIAEHSFNIPSLVIQASCSMPWTFIFPIDSMKSKATFENVKMIFIMK